MRLPARVGVLLAGVGVLLGASPSARGADHARRRDVAGGPVMVINWSLQANSPVTFETLNLQASGLTAPGENPDTVIRVFETRRITLPGGRIRIEAGNYLAGNDECGSESFRSCVTLPASPVTREVLIVVRAYNERRGGRTDLKLGFGGGSFALIERQQFGGAKLDFDPSADVQVSTVRQNGGVGALTLPGSTDTILMVEGPNPGDFRFNDDAADDLKMSSLTAGRCPTGCSLIIGDRTFAEGDGTEVRRLSTVIWDRVPNTVPDGDGDGLSDALERLIGSSAGQVDTDADGLDDYIEVFGLPHHLLQLPYMGADPLKPDVFVEMDYVPNNQWTAVDAARMVRAFRVNGFRPVNSPQGPLPELDRIPADSRDIRVHLDIGVANTDPRTKLMWGDWGGANVVPAARVQHCVGFTPERNTYVFRGKTYKTFHYQLDDGTYGNNAGRCSVGRRNLTSLPHELGHGLGLSHGGLPASGNDLNGNALYPSIMNYSYDHGSDDDRQHPAFSVRRFGDLRLVPTALPEKNWTSAAVGYLKLFTNVSGTSVDWNMDGIFSDAPVRGHLTLGQEVARMGEQWLFSDTAGAPARLSDPALAWLPGRGLHLFAIETRLGMTNIIVRTASSLAACEQPRPNPREACVTWTGQARVAGTTGALGGFAVTRYQSAPGRWNLLILFRRSDNVLRYITVDGQTYQWSAEQAVADGAQVGGSIGAARSPVDDGVVRVLAPLAVGAAGGQLHRWDFHGPTATWPLARAPQRYEGRGDAVMVNGFGAVPINAPIVGEQGQSQVALVTLPAGTTRVIRYVESGRAGVGQRWRSLNLDRTEVVSSRPGFAYLPFDPGNRAEGQFFQVWVTDNANPAIVRTTGNNPNPPTVNGLRQRALAWHFRVEAYLIYTDLVFGGMLLHFDPDFDRNLRGAFGDGAPGAMASVRFHPLADGRANTPFIDYDDWSVMKQNLPLALR